MRCDFCCNKNTSFDQGVSSWTFYVSILRVYKAYNQVNFPGELLDWTLWATLYRTQGSCLDDFTGLILNKISITLLEPRVIIVGIVMEAAKLL